MQLRHLKTVQEPHSGIQKVTAMTWSPNNRRLAVVTTDRTVFLYDESGEKRDKFATKPGDSKGSKSYVVRALAFSPDSEKLAIAQSDNIVFVYKLGLEWGDKKSICNKFAQTSSITCLAWPSQRANELVFGCLDGQVKIGNLRSNKHSKLYALDAAPVSAASNPEGTGFVTGHLDGSILRFMFDDGVSGPSQTKLVVHNSVPYTLGWGHSICAAGNDQQVTFYDSKDGRLLQTYDYANDETEKEFTSCVFNPSGESCLVGSFNRFRVFSYSFRRNQWDEDGVKNIDNFYTVSSLCWKPDGSRVAVGSLCGAVELYDSCIRRYQYRGKFEFTYISLSQVIVKRLSSGARIVLKSLYGYEIIKVNIYHDQFIVGLSTDTLLVGDLESCKLSEVPWPGGGQEKFYFQNPHACLVYSNGELSLIEYARNEILGSCRTEHMNPHLISVRINERKYDTDNKKIAYLVDLQTISIYDLHHAQTLSTIEHDSKIDWLELNTAGTVLLFRDKRRQLHLYDIANSNRSTLLNYCSYVQWVPDSDVVVAQSRHSLKVWYSINAPERVTNFSIKGEVQDIERVDGRTVVLVDEGVQTVHIALDETLIQFGSAIEMQDFERAVDILEQLDLTPETEAMWQNLSNLAIQDRRLKIAERCFAALGDAPKTWFLHRVNKIARQITGDGGVENGNDHFRVKARMAMLNKQFRSAESILLDKDHVEEAMDMYQELHRWDDVLRIARLKQHPDLDKMVRSYLEWLMESGQEEKAAQLKEQEGDYIEAVKLYLKGGLPARAAALVNANSGVNYQSDLLHRVADSLIRTGVYEKAGDFYERNLGMLDKAMEAYKKGHAYRRAVDLARHSFPQEVVTLEEEWGDWLVNQKQVDAAINHFIEAGKYIKAIEAAITANQWAKAVQIVETQDPETASGFYKRIAAHYAQTKHYEAAEKYYVKAGMHKEVVQMYTKANMWEQAHKKAMSYMSKEEVEALYKSQARALEENSQYRDAEKLLVLIKQPDSAIAMYKRNRQYDDMIRLVEQYHREFVPQTHIKLGQQFEGEGNFKKAEHHFVEGKDWGAAVNMYRNQGMWPDAMRVAKLHGGQGASNQVAYTWAVSLGGEAGIQLLRKYGLVKEAITYAIEHFDFKYALELANSELKSMVPEVNLKFAMYLEDEGRFTEAEQAFIAAAKPKEAIDMYVHQRDWSNAERVGQMHDPNSLPDVYVARGRASVEDGNHQEAEGWYLRAQKPEEAVVMYKSTNKWQEAIRVAKEYMPNKVREINAEYAMYLQGTGDGSKADLMAPGKALEEAREYSRAIDAYLQANKALTQDHDYLEEIWETAVKLSMNHVPARVNEVVAEVSKRLLDIKRYEPAAEIWVGIEQYKNAIDIYLKAQLWDKAKHLANTKMPEYAAEVQRQQVEHLKEAKDTDALLDIGNTNSALDLYVQQGQWEKCLELAAEQNATVALRYATMYARHLLEEGKYVEAVKVFGRYGAPADLNNAALYIKLNKYLISTSTPENGAANALPELAQMMHKVMAELAGNSDPRVKELEKWRLLAHLAAIRSKCHDSVPELTAKASVSLLRYIHDLPADKAFYEAGTTTKDANLTSMSFVFLNRYLDLSEAMEDGDPNVQLENADFENTDIPYDFPIPEKQSVADDKREAVRDWLLAVSMDQQIEQELPLQTCDFCRTDIYEAALSCHSCQSKYEPCVITGYPVRKASYLNCKNCQSPANREDWNKYVMQFKECPWCEAPQNPNW